MSTYGSNSADIEDGSSKQQQPATFEKIGEFCVGESSVRKRVCSSNLSDTESGDCKQLRRDTFEEIARQRPATFEEIGRNESTVRKTACPFKPSNVKGGDLKRHRLANFENTATDSEDNSSDVSEDEDHSSVVPKDADDSSVAPKDGDDSPVAPKDGDDSSVAPKDGDDSSVVSEDGDDSSVDPKDGDDSSVAPKDGDDSSVAPKDGDDSSVAPKDGDDSSVVSEDGDDSSVAPKDGDDSSVAPKDEDDSSVAPKDGDNSSVAPKDGDDSSIAPKDGDDSSVAPKDGYDSSVAPKDGDDSSVAPKDEEDSSVAPKDGDDSSVAPKDGEDLSVPPKDGDDSSVAPKDGDDSSVPPKDGDDSSVAPKDGDDSSVATKDGEDSSVATKDGDDSSIAPKDGDDSSVAPKDEEDSSIAPKDGDDSSIAPEDEDDSPVAPKDGDDSSVASEDEYDSSVATKDEEDSSFAPEDEDDSSTASKYEYVFSYNYVNFTPQEKDKLNDFFGEIVSKAAVDFSNPEFQDIQSAVTEMLERIKTWINERGIFSISRLEACGSMAEKTAMWKRNGVSMQPLIEFDFLAVLQAAGYAELDCEECLSVNTLPANLELLEKYYHGFYNFYQREQKYKSTNDYCMLYNLHLFESKYMLERCFIRETNECLVSCGCLGVRYRDEYGEIFMFEPSSTCSKTQQGCDKCTVDRPTGTLRVHTSAWIGCVKTECSLIFKWTRNAEVLYLRNKWCLPETEKMDNLTIHIDFVPALEVFQSKQLSQNVAACSSSELVFSPPSNEYEHHCFLVPKHCAACGKLRNVDTWRRSGCRAEIDIIVNEMSDKHRKCYQVLKYLIEETKHSWKHNINNYHLKIAVLRHNSSCSDASEHNAKCVLKVLDELQHAYIIGDLESLHSQANLFRNENSNLKDYVEDIARLKLAMRSAVSESDTLSSFIEGVQNSLSSYLLFPIPSTFL